MSSSETPSSAVPPTLLADPVATRNQYLSHEASIQSIGYLYLIGAVGSVIACAIGLFQDEKPLPERIMFVALLVVFAGLYYWLGNKLRKLDPVAQTPATVLSCIGLIGFPIGTVISIYIIWLLQSKKGKLVFSPAYREVINATPQIKYRMSIVIWILLGLVLALILFAFLVPLLAKKH